MTNLAKIKKKVCFSYSIEVFCYFEFENTTICWLIVLKDMYKIWEREREIL